MTEKTVKRILAIGAHPDDIEIGCGGYLQTECEGLMIILSSGEEGFVSQNSNKNARRNEAVNAAAILGCDLEIFNLQDTKIQQTDAARILEEAIKRFQPHTILTMSSKDTHQDHIAVAKATNIAARNTACTVLSYLGPSSMHSFNPNWFLALSEDVMKRKLEAIACHESQSSRTYLSEKSITSTAEYWALATRSGHRYVEPFELIKYWDWESR